MKKNFLLKLCCLLFSVIFSFTSFAQQNPNVKADTNTLVNFLKKGKFDGQIRSFFMNTINEGKLSDYYALAAGAGFGYHTAEWKGLSAGLSSFTFFNIASSDLNKKDSLSNQKSRYEIGLYDMTNPANKSGLIRSEELYVKYRMKNTQLILGRQFITTPFINKQDGRMRPTIVEGIYLKSTLKTKWSFDAGWLTQMSPRTTVDWFSIAESIGIYAAGVNANGAKSEYPGNTKSKGVAIAGVQFKNKATRLQAWNTYVENIMNTIFLQAENRLPINEKNTLLAGVQYVYQNSSADGGNPEINKRYYEKGNHTWIISSRIGFETAVWRTNFNYLHISNSSRFLMPREWGIEPFYTFLKRERNEGWVRWMHGR